MSPKEKLALIEEIVERWVRGYEKPDWALWEIDRVLRSE